jgi:outer membrane protein OmpA-like peptidoglycan-associated protein
MTMRGARRSAFLTVGSLAIVAALAGCAGFGKWSSSTEAPAEPVATAAPEPATATPAPVTAQPPAAPASAAETATAPAPSSNGFTELTGLADVRFRSGQVGVVKADFKVLDSLVRWLKENPSSVVMIEGHTDDLGSRDDNLAVGEKRAASVARYLVSKGLEPARISATSVGSERPVCAEKTDACRAKNRRARFLVKQR